MRMAVDCTRIAHKGFSTAARGKARGRRKIAAAAGVTEQAIYLAQSGRKANGEIWLKNVLSQAERNQKPRDGEQRCICCGTIRAHSEYRKRGNRIKKKCEKCERGFYNGGKLTWEALKKIKLNRANRAIVSNAEATYKNFDYPILIHLAMRRQGIANQAISERLGIKNGKVKRMARALGVINPTTKVCASGSAHPGWKGGKAKTSITNEWIWNQEVKQFRRAERLSSWDQHELSTRWEWRKKYQKTIADPEKKKAWLKIRERYRREKLGQKPWKEYLESVERTDKDQIRARENLRSNTVECYKRGSDRYNPTIGCSGKQLREWLKRQFKGHMTHENYGKCWNIDHIAPLASFDLSDPKQYGMAANFNNLQPLYCKANSKKGATTDGQLGIILQVIDS